MTDELTTPDVREVLPDDHGYDILQAEIRQAFGRVVYTHKAQEKCADDKLFWFKVTRWVQTGLAAATTTGFFAVILGDPTKHHDSAVAGAVASLLLTALNLYAQGGNAMGDVDKHTATASKLWLAREQYLSLLSDIKARTIKIEEAKQIRNTLQTKLAEIYSTAPRTNKRAYKAAQSGLKDNEELTFRDHEIDVFLPVELRKVQPTSSQ